MQALASSTSHIRCLPPRGAAWRPSAPPSRRCCRRHPHLASSAAVGVAAVEESTAEFARLVAANGKVTKTAIGKLSVAELRAQCQRVGLPSEGLKAVLVERLLDWWQQQQQQQRLSNSQPASVHQVEEHQGQKEGQPGAVQQLGSSSTRTTPTASASSTPANQVEASAPAAVPAISSGAKDSITSSIDRPAGLSQRSPQDPADVSVTWLGTSSGNPTPRRNVSAIAVRFDDAVYMVDCGEGTRNQMRKGGVDPGAVRRIFVTHMHGDHCFGLGGVIEAVCQARRGTPLEHQPLYVYGPPELHPQVLAAVRMGATQLSSPVVVTGWVLDPSRARTPQPADSSGMLRLALQGPDQGERVPAAMARGLQVAYDQGSEKVVQPGLTWTVRVPGGPTVTAAQLQHRVPCWGYVFQEAPQAVPPPKQAAPVAPTTGGAASGDVAPEGAALDGVLSQEGQQRGDGERDEVQQQGQQEQGVQEQGSQWVRRGRKLVILGDTCNSTAIAGLALGCDLLSHEATFCSGMEDKAAIAQHSTTEQAGAFAAAVEARNLVLTHFSARYESLSGIASTMRRSSAAPRSSLKVAVVARDLKRGEMQRLLDETYSTYGKDSIYLASDFYTFKVPPPPPMPAHELQQQQAEQAKRTQEVQRKATAAAGGPARRSGRDGQQQKQQWQPRGQGSRPGQRQHRHQGQGQRRQWQQRAGAGGRQGLEGQQQQYQNRQSKYSAPPV